MSAAKNNAIKSNTHLWVVNNVIQIETIMINIIELAMHKPPVNVPIGVCVQKMFACNGLKNRRNHAGIGCCNGIVEISVHCKAPQAKFLWFQTPKTRFLERNRPENHFRISKIFASGGQTNRRKSSKFRLDTIVGISASSAGVRAGTVTWLSVGTGQTYPFHP